MSSESPYNLCKRGHIFERGKRCPLCRRMYRPRGSHLCKTCGSLFSGRCLTCVKARQKKYYQKHRAQSIARATEWNKSHPEQRKAIQQRWNEAHRQERRTYYAAHREHILSHATEWRRAHPERYQAAQKRWREAHRKMGEVGRTEQAAPWECWLAAKMRAYSAEERASLAKFYAEEAMRLTGACIESVTYIQERIYINPSAYFDAVTQEAWQRCVKGEQVASLWLETRKGSVLSPETILEYRLILDILTFD